MNKHGEIEEIKEATNRLMNKVSSPQFRRKMEGPPQIVQDATPFPSEDSIKRACIDVISDTFSVRADHVRADLLSNESTADTGMIGFFNRRARNRRQKKYFKKVLAHFDGIKVVSEGDSWYQYPVFVKDTIDWISQDPQFAVYSLGFGGDWLANILEEGEYIQALPVHKPVFFLISGAGNDLLENYRLAALLKYAHEVNSNQAKDYILQGFYDLITVFKYLYVKMFLNLANRFPTLKIVVHGYGYAIPNIKKGGSLGQLLSHNIVGQGIWLYTPLLLRGIREAQLQQEIVRLIIDAFNEMLIELSQHFSHVYYLDLRNIIGKNDWHDEIHPNSATFQKISQLYVDLMKRLH